MKKLKRVNFDESDLLHEDEMSNVRGGGWTENTVDTYVGADGDCYSSCDSYGGDTCGDGGATLSGSVGCSGPSGGGGPGPNPFNN